MTTENAYDLLLKGGTLLDPASERHEEADVGVTAGAIAAVGVGLSEEGAGRVIDVSGCYVTPGLIDFHVHSYWGVNPFGFDADPLCLSTGVTTAVDAGSAGPVNFLGFKKLVAEVAKTRMLAFVSLAQHGVWTTPGELEDLRFADPDGSAATVNENPDVAVGIKVRLSRRIVGENGREALRLAIVAGEASKSPVMVHVGNTIISMEEILNTLRPGDIVTHCYTPQAPSVVDENGKVLDAALRAKERGVIFDVAHAGGHFDFDLVRSAMQQGLLPDIISSDIHGLLLSRPNPVKDMPTTMSKFLPLGLSLDEIIAASTTNPAKAIGWQDRLGSIESGRAADLAVLEVIEGAVTFQDSVGKELASDQRIAARWTVRAGLVYEGAG
ncbi:MAG: dihydroorotase [Chloroflexi bacterium]|nr:MAG: dihydroorotase [Chloroflexota bacterium]